MPIFKEIFLDKVKYFFNTDLTKETLDPENAKSRYIRYMNYFFDDFINYKEDDFNDKIKINDKLNFDTFIRFENRFNHFKSIEDNKDNLIYDESCLINGKLDKNKFNQVINNYENFRKKFIIELVKNDSSLKEFLKRNKEIINSNTITDLIKTYKKSEN